MKRGDAITLHFVAFLLYVSLLVYSCVEFSDVTTKYPLSKNTIAVDPLTGYLVADGIVLTAANLNSIEIIIATAALCVAFKLVFVIAYCRCADWTENAQLSGSNVPRWILAVVSLSMVSIIDFQRLGLVDESILMTLFGLVGSSQLFLMVSEIIASRPIARKLKVRYNAVNRTGKMGVSPKKAVAAVVTASSALFPILIAFIIVYIRFVNADKTGLQDHVYLYATLPFIVLIFNVMWTILFAVGCLNPGTLYEAGHVLALLIIVIPVGFTVTYYSDSL